MHRRITFEEFASEKSFQPPKASAKAFPDKFKYFDGLIRLELGSDPDRPSLNFSSHHPCRHDLLKVKKVPEGHAAYNEGKGFGVYAKKLIEKGTVLGEYGGLVLTKSKLRTPEEKNMWLRLAIDTRVLYESAYDLEQSDGDSISAAMWGNEMRFINHYENVGESVNVIYEKVSNITAGVKEYTPIKAICDIKPGEELLVDYQDDYCHWKKIGKFDPRFDNKLAAAVHANGDTTIEQPYEHCGNQSSK